MEQMFEERKEEKDANNKKEEMTISGLCPRATIMGLNVAGECGLKGGGEESRLLSEGGICEVSEYVRPVPLGDRKAGKCCPGVPMNIVGRQ